MRNLLFATLSACAAVLGVSLFGVSACAADGSPDPGFGTDGRVTLKWADGISVPMAVAVDSNDRIVIAGSATAYTTGASTEFMVTRLLPDGRQDATFATDQQGFRRYGFGLAGIGGPSDDEASSVLLQPDGRIVAAGTAKFGPTYGHMAAIRLDDAGDLDPMFGEGGAVHFGYPQAYESHVYTSVLDGSGNITLAGTASYRPSDTNAFANDLAVARLRPNGTLDGSFGSGGIGDYLYLPTSPTQVAADMVSVASIDSGGNIFVAGNSNRSDLVLGALLSLTSGGGVQVSYGAAGRVFLGPAVIQITSVVPVSGGKLMVAGQTTDANSNAQMFLARLAPDGTLDPTFGQGGMAVASIQVPTTATLLARTHGGGWLLAGPDNGYGILLVRFTGSGVVDAGFGTQGVLHVVFDPVNFPLFYPSRPVISADGRLVVAGALPEEAANGNADFGVMRILADYDVIFADGFDDP